MREHVAQTRPDLLEAVVELMGVDPFELAENETRCAQPAIYCASLALHERWLSAEGIEPSFAAGHSLGELAALVAAGVLDAHAGLRLVIERSRLMHEACERSGGGMVAAMGRGARDAVADAARFGIVVANDNAPEQVIVAGPHAALDEFVAWAEERGDVKIRRLEVAGAFHSPAMASAVDGFRGALARTSFARATIPVFSCVTAAPFDNPRARLLEGVLAPVRWRETVLAMRAAGAERFVESGPGRVLSGLVKRTLRQPLPARTREEVLARG
jgi:malonyl CoA-acyl carrier protein transacylase